MAEWPLQQSGTRQCTPQAGTVKQKCASLGRWYLDLPGRLNPHWFSPADAMQAFLPISVALGWASLHGVEIPHSPGEGD